MKSKIVKITRATNLGYRITFEVNGVITESNGVFTLDVIMLRFGLTRDELAEYLHEIPVS